MRALLQPEVPNVCRSEPQLGSWSLALIHDRLGDSWIVDLLLEPLIAWNNWTWAERRAPALDSDAAADGVLLSLGSSATNPAGLNTPHTLAAARYESGLDNSPMSATAPNPNFLCRSPLLVRLRALRVVLRVASHLV